MLFRSHRFERYGKGGQLLESRVVNRTATFVFYLGDSHFGTLTALVPGVQAGQFGFTSSLTAQILKTLLPQLQPHLFLQQPKPATPPATETVTLPVPAAPAPVVPRAPAIEKPDGATSQAAPPAKEPPSHGGFPEDLEPSVVVPVPIKLPAAPTAPAVAPTPAKVPTAPIPPQVPAVP